MAVLAMLEDIANGRFWWKCAFRDHATVDAHLKKCAQFPDDCYSMIHNEKSLLVMLIYLMVNSVYDSVHAY